MASTPSLAWPASSSSAPAPPPPHPPRPALPPLKESREFILETYTIWASLQRIVADHDLAHLAAYRSAAAPPPDQVQYYARVCALYQDALVRQLPLLNADASLTPAGKAKALAHHAHMHGVLALAQLLYFPKDGTGDGLVAEELIDWVNTVDPAPSAQDGNDLLALAQPWHSPAFFPYLDRCLVRGHLASAAALLSLVHAHHPCPPLRDLATRVGHLLEGYPRSSAFRTESAFLSALRQWRAHLASTRTQHVDPLLASLASGSAPDLDRAEAGEWASSLRTLVDVLSSSASSTSSSAASTPSDLLQGLSTDYLDALSSHALFRAPATLRRADLPALVGAITSSQHPVDSSLADQVAHAALLRGDVPALLRALTAGGYSWAATHVADLLSHLHLAAFDPPQGDARDGRAGALGLREHFLLDWGERTTVDPGLWRVSCEYWAACGEQGRERVRELVRGISLEVPPVDAAAAEEDGETTGGMDVEPSSGSGGLDKENVAPSMKTKKKQKAPRQVDEILAVLAALDLVDEFTLTCQNYAALLVEHKRFGEAVAYAVRAGDGRRIAEIAELILEEYIQNGQDAFIAHVDSIPTSLLRPSPSLPSPPSSPSSSTLPPALPSALSTAPHLAPYTARLTFLARYRDFFALYASGARREAAALLCALLSSQVAPRAFWAVMLLDAVPLLETTPPLVSLAETYDLLRILEDVVGPVAAAPARDTFGALDMLGRLAERRAAGGGKKGGKGEGAGKGESERLERALGQMNVVRGALARHLAICCCLE